MKILQTNNYQYQQRNFKATYPVVHRIIHNGTYIPESDIEVIKKLQRKLVNVLNSPLEKILNSLDKDARANVANWISSYSLEGIKSNLKLPQTEKEALAIFRGRFGFMDLDYAYASEGLPKKEKNKTNKIKSNQYVRSFYNRVKGMLDGRYYLTYMISGKDIKPFEDDLAKNIGKAKHESKSLTDNVYSEVTKDAIDSYNQNGLEFVNDPNYRLKSKTTGMTYILRANFEAVRNKSGKIKDYKFVDAKFVPEYTK